MQRQAKRLRAETEATAYSTIAPSYGQPRISAGTGSTIAGRKPAWKRPFLFGRRAPPLPAADEGGLSAPQPRLWRAVAKQDRERHSRQGGRTVSLFGQVPKREMGLDLRSLPPASTTRKTDCHGPLRGLAMTCRGASAEQEAATPHPPCYPPSPQGEGLRTAGLRVDALGRGIRRGDGLLELLLVFGHDAELVLQPPARVRGALQHAQPEAGVAVVVVAQPVRGEAADRLPLDLDRDVGQLALLL